MNRILIFLISQKIQSKNTVKHAYNEHVYNDIYSEVIFIPRGF